MFGGLQKSHMSPKAPITEARLVLLLQYPISRRGKKAKQETKLFVCTGSEGPARTRLPWGAVKPNFSLPLASLLLSPISFLCLFVEATHLLSGGGSRTSTLTNGLPSCRLCGHSLTAMKVPGPSWAPPTLSEGWQRGCAGPVHLWPAALSPRSQQLPAPTGFLLLRGREQVHHLPLSRGGDWLEFQVWPQWEHRWVWSTMSQVSAERNSFSKPGIFFATYLMQTISWTPKSLQMVMAAMKLKDACSLEEKLWPT